MADNEHERSTRPLDEIQAQEIDGVVRVSFVFQLRERTLAFTLSAGERTEVGRTRGFVVDHESLSRRHAQISVRTDGTVEVEDLESSNGTLINDERVRGGRVRPGDRLTLGSLPVSVHWLRPGSEDLKGLEDHATFVRKLEERVIDAREFGRACAVLILRAPGEADALLSALGEQLRPHHCAARYADEVIEIILPEHGPEEANAFARDLQVRVRELSAGIATFPSAGRTADELLERARGALQDAPGIRSGDREIARAADDAGAPIVRDPAMRRLYDTVGKAAASKIPVIVHGETGAGKELVASALHTRSGRKGKQINVNCGALASTLLEATLFGSVRGAFSDAHDKAGVFEEADGGTVFLDEIGELPAAAQAALLRVLDTGRVTRLGTTSEIEVDARIVTATHRNLEQMVEAGTFRQDLFERIRGLELAVPPLRRRREEILPLAERFLERAGGGLRLGDDTRALLETHDWPGNVRELKNAIERAVIVADGDVITAGDLPARIREANAVEARAEDTGEFDVIPIGGHSLKDILEDYERQVLLSALERCDGNQTEAAKLLKMALRTFVYKLNKLGIKRGGAGHYVDKGDE